MTRAPATMRNDQFPLEDVPHELIYFIVEKMACTDVARLNICNRFGSIASDCVPKSVRKYFHAGIIKINENSTMALIACNWVLLCDVPFRIRCFCEKLVIKNDRFIEEVRRYEITTHSIKISDDLLVDAKFLKKLLKMTKARQLKCRNVDIAILELEEIRHCSSLNLSLTTREYCDSLLFQMEAREISLRGMSFSEEGLATFIQEWFEGRRNIDKIYVYNRHFDVREFLSQMERKEEIHSGPEINFDEEGHVYLCRRPNHSDCLQVNETLWRLEIHKYCPCPNGKHHENKPKTSFLLWCIFVCFVYFLIIFTVVVAPEMLEGDHLSEDTFEFCM